MNFPIVVRQLGRFLMVMSALLGIHAVVAALHWGWGYPL